MESAPTMAVTALKTVLKKLLTELVTAVPKLTTTRIVDVFEIFYEVQKKQMIWSFINNYYLFGGLLSLSDAECFQKRTRRRVGS